MFRTYSYPLRPTKAQEVVLIAWLAQCCDLYNAALQERRDAWKKYKVSIGLYEQCKGLAAWRQSDPVAALVPSDVQRSALRRIDRAFKAFFRRCKSGEKPGYPRFKSKRRYDSFTVPWMDVGLSTRVVGNLLDLPKIKGIRFHLYRPLQGTIVQVTVRREHFGKWSVFFQCDLGAAPAPMAPASIVGVDVGLRSLAVTSDGEVIPNPRHAAKAAAKLARIQRVLARRKKGSRSRERALVQVAKAHQHIRNQRLDTARKVACQLVSRYDVIAFEQLVICRMVRGNLAKSIHDAGWGVLLRAIACKAESAGKWAVAVNPYRTSQDCSQCGATVPKGLKVRVHRCPHCGLVMDRDENAAINICALGRSAVTEAWQKRQAEARSAA